MVHPAEELDSVVGAGAAVGCGAIIKQQHIVPHALLPPVAALSLSASRSSRVNFGVAAQPWAVCCRAVTQQSGPRFCK
eukprot:10245552-Alexandrium_andersonii.AAC.1